MVVMVRRPVLLVVGWPVPPSLTPPGAGAGGDGPKAGAGGGGVMFILFTFYLKAG